MTEWGGEGEVTEASLVKCVCVCVCVCGVCVCVCVSEICCQPEFKYRTESIKKYKKLLPNTLSNDLYLLGTYLLSSEVDSSSS